jgi:hypothetical protein
MQLHTPLLLEKSRVPLRCARRLTGAPAQWGKSSFDEVRLSSQMLLYFSHDRGRPRQMQFGLHHFAARVCCELLQ